VKILAINASLRGEHGHCGFLIEKIFEGAAAAGATCESVALSRQKINRCLACEKCQGKDRYLNCVQEDKDDVKAIFDKMVWSDIIIYASPVYVFAMSSLLKALLERMYGTADCSDLRLSRSGLMFHHINHEISSKPFVSLVCCDNLEDETPENVARYFRTFSKFMDAPQVGSLVRNGGRIAGYGSDTARQQIFPSLREIYAAYVQAGQELATQGRVSKATQKKAGQEILPVPFFSIGKRFKPFKKIFIKKARAMMDSGMME
jgi:NAD(P)H-dependent FMN reductase